MKYLSPQIAKIAKRTSGKSLVKRVVSCGIFQELGENDVSIQPNAIYKKQQPSVK